MNSELVMNGRPVDISGYNDANLLKASKLFSEGNENLAKVLYFLNKMDITTFSCCKGHGEDDGFIAFYLKDGNSQKIANILNSILLFNVKITLANVKRNFHKYPIIKITIPNMVQDDIYKTIMNLNNCNQNNQIIMNYLRILLIFSHSIPTYEFSMKINKENDSLKMIFIEHTIMNLKTRLQYCNFFYHIISNKITPMDSNEVLKCLTKHD